MSDKTITINLTLNNKSGYDSKRLGNLVWELQEDLLETGLGSVDLVSSEGRDSKTRSGDNIADALLVTLAASGGVLTTLINVLQSWLTRSDRRSLTLEIDGDKLEISGMSSDEQKKLIGAFLTRHTSIIVASD